MPTSFLSTHFFIVKPPLSVCPTPTFFLPSPFLLLRIPLGAPETPSHSGILYSSSSLPFFSIPPNSSTSRSGPYFLKFRFHPILIKRYPLASLVIYLEHSILQPSTSSFFQSVHSPFSITASVSSISFLSHLIKLYFGVFLAICPLPFCRIFLVPSLHHLIFTTPMSTPQASFVALFWTPLFLSFSH